MGFLKHLFRPKQNQEDDLHALLAELSQPPQSIIDMPRRIELCRSALAQLPRSANPPLWAALQGTLGDSLSQTPQGDRANNIEQAITAYQNVLQVRTLDTTPFEWSHTMMNLATAYRNRIRGDRADNIEQAIETYQKSLQVRTRDAMPIEWATTMMNLATAYRNRILGNRANNIEQAITIYKGVLQVRTREAMPHEWAQTMMNLANAYYSRIRGSHADNIERAINAYQNALQIITPAAMPIEWAQAMMNLATAYIDRIQGDRAKNIEQAITVIQEALQIMTRDTMPVEWAQTINNLANAYSKRIRGNRDDNIERAINAYQDALRIRTRDAMPIDWAKTMLNLATAYSDRIRGDRTDNIEQAIFAYQDALQVLTNDAMPIDWALATMSLANAYYNRIRGDRAENIEQAIIAYQNALNVFTYDALPIDWAKVMINLANAYSNRINGDQADNIEKAIAAYQKAFKVFTRNAMPIDWATNMMNLGASYYTRIHGNRADNIEKSITAFQDVLQVFTQDAMPSDWAKAMVNLATAYSNRIKGNQADNIELAINAYKDVLQEQTIEYLPVEYRNTQHLLGNLFFAESYWGDALSCYQAAIDAGQVLFANAYTEEGRKAELGETIHLFARAAYCLWQTNQPIAALQKLEQGKTRLLNEALALGDVNLALLPTATQQTIRVARQTIRKLEGEMRLPQDTPARRTDHVLAEELQTARARLQQQLDTIQKQHPNFLLNSLDVPGILALIPDGGALIAPFATHQGGAVFIIPYGTRQITNAHILSLPNLSRALIRELIEGSIDSTVLGGWLGGYDQFLTQRTPIALRHWQATISNITQKLWQNLMGAIHEQLVAYELKPSAPVLLMSQGGLGMLPLHAAWREVNNQPRFFCDDYSVTYVPSAYVLHISRKRAVQPERQARSLFVAINPTSDPKLKYTSIEGEAITQYFSTTHQTISQGNDVTTTAFQSTAKSYAYIHYSGHGYYHWRDSTQSGLQLADKPYTLSNILSGLDLSTCRLVTLSACETGITEFQKTPDEYVGLPTGFLQAGAPAVVSTLWAVNDLSTMLLMDRFYQLHLQDSFEMVDALRQAQLWLRDEVTAGELAKWFGHEAQQLMTRLSKEEVLKYWHRFENMDAEERPFAHPYYWAAFTFTGA